MDLVIFDWKWTLYHPPSDTLMTGAQPLLDYLHNEGIRLVVIGKDQGGDMNAKVNALAIRQYLDATSFVTDNKSIKLFRQFSREFDPEKVWVVGDRVNSEIAIGNQLRARTVWIRKGKFAQELPQKTEAKPEFTFKSLDELLKFLKSSQAT